jgi:hypothetical protein
MLNREDALSCDCDMIAVEVFTSNKEGPHILYSKYTEKKVLHTTLSREWSKHY